MGYYAHTFNGPDGKPLGHEHWQPLKDHLRAVADLARNFAEPLGLGPEAEIAGLLHDLGKYASRFQARLHDNSIHGVNHWAAGAAYAAQTLKQFSAAFAVAGHHTGMPALDGDGLKQTVACMQGDADRQRLTGCPEPLDQLLARFREDGIGFEPPLPHRIIDRFAEAFRARMTFSCLVDADFLDTEAHFDPTALVQRTTPSLEEARALALLLDHLSRMPQQGSVNEGRRRLLADCVSAARQARGLFTLTAPTGSGKTLSSLAFALQHIACHNQMLSPDDPGRLRRIIVVIPFTSIIEQTAQVYRDLFEPMFGQAYVLEHHSAVAPGEQRQDQRQDAEEERLRRARIAAENWAPPLVVTTSVQFFESLFSNRPSDCRKLHRIARSVVLFDEVQTLPPHLLPSLLSAVRLLTSDYGTTAAFMTATQPAFAAASAALPYGWNPVEISSQPTAMADALRRTRIELPAPSHTVSWPQLARLIASEPQALCVVNTTADARLLFELLRVGGCAGVSHLSSRLCPQHRREKLAAIRKRLRDGSPCRLVSTQLIEAGVDVDFPIAWRALGPLDSIIQTAGRCNREGRHEQPCPVIIFRPETHKLPPGVYALAAAKTEEFLARHPDAAAQLHRPEFYAAYFRELYGLVGPRATTEDPVFVASEQLDFPKAADECRLIGQATRPVLVKWGSGTELVEQLSREKHLTASECRQAQGFSVNLYQHEWIKAQACGYTYQPAEGWDFWVWNSDYDGELGLGHLDVTSLTL